MRKIPEGVIALAPMAGYSDFAFRTVCRLWGADLVYSEMTAARFLLAGGDIPKDSPVVQLFGSDPQELAEAARLVESSAMWVNFNAACPVRKVAEKGAGVALLGDLRRLRIIVRRMRSVLQKPLSVKIRLGLEKNVVEKIISLLLEEGVDLIELHPRTARQLYSGKVDRKVFAHIKERFPVALYASGDIFTPHDVRELFEVYGVDGVLVARGAVGSPWIFRSSKLYMKEGRVYSPDVDEILETIELHLRLLKLSKGPRAAAIFRKFISGYTRGMRNARKYRLMMMREDSVEGLIKLFREFMLAHACHAQYRELYVGGGYEDGKEDKSADCETGARWT